jgi:hypothetical protein
VHRVSSAPEGQGRYYAHSFLGLERSSFAALRIVFRRIRSLLSHSENRWSWRCTVVAGRVAPKQDTASGARILTSAALRFMRLTIVSPNRASRPIHRRSRTCVPPSSSSNRRRRTLKPIPERVGLMGDSAGAHLAALTALAYDWAPFAVGIELGRDNGEVEGSHSRPFGCEMAAHFHQRHVFRGPPIMPDGGISPVRFEVLACPP